MLGFLFVTALSVAPSYAVEPIRCGNNLSRLGSSATFQQALSRLLNRACIDDEPTRQILSVAAKNVKVIEADIDPEQIKIRRAFVSRNRHQLILRWPLRQKFESNDDDLTEKLAEVVVRLLHKDATSFGVYTQSLNQFIDQNMQALTLKMILLQTASHTKLLLKTTWLRRFVTAFKNPDGRNLQLDQTIDKLLITSGASGVTDYLRRFYGPSLGLRYLMRHAKNAGLAVSLGAVLYVAPIGADTWRVMRQEGSVSIKEADRAITAEILANFEKTDAQMLETLQSQSSASDLLRRFLKTHQNQIPNEIR